MTPSGAAYFTYIAVSPAVHPDPQRFIDIVARFRMGSRKPFGNLFQALNLKADMVNTAVIQAVFSASYIFNLKIQNR
ncbi:MAG: hypothetical protein ETSY2_42375 [Candidatus Entotheonella gemina]|uniref:Uncharacterized protein n=1 Tax=Candidatus Entotheonella gemina TaxID=1429439 RepID=W4LLB4_9BACT|nr:MAG: hypothetical protein ETSY2_42375 [Candidatus Entotheonella gemina]